MTQVVWDQLVLLDRLVQLVSQVLQVVVEVTVPQEPEVPLDNQVPLEKEQLVTQVQQVHVVQQEQSEILVILVLLVLLANEGSWAQQDLLVLRVPKDLQEKMVVVLEEALTDLLELLAGQVQLDQEEKLAGLEKEVYKVKLVP